MTDPKPTDLSETAKTAEDQTGKFRQTGQTQDDQPVDTSAHVTENMPDENKDVLKDTMKD